MGRLSAWKGHSFISLPLRVFVGCVFLAACHHKILDPASFALDVATYDILPLWLVNLVVIFLPWLELAAAIMLIAGFRTRAAALLVSGMMVVFIAALSVALAKGLDMSCGCFASQGVAEDPISWKTLGRDGIWLVMGIYIMAFDSRPIGVDALICANSLSAKRS